jgi:hypothetical protein
MGTIITAILSGAGKLLPFIGPMLERFLPGESSKVAEYRAKKELIEARAFARGRYSPGYIIWYGVAFLFIAYGVVILIAAFAPGIFIGADQMLHHLKTMIGLAQEAQQ